MMQNKLKDEVKNLSFSKIRDFNKVARKYGAKYFLTIGEPDFDTYKNIKDKVKEGVDKNLTHYSNDVGMPELISEIINWEKNENQVKYEEEEVIVTVGSTEALKISFEAVICPEDEIIVFTPCYPLYGQLINLYQGKQVAIDTSSNGFQVSFEELENALSPKTKAIILNSPNNPTGCIMSEESMKNIYRFAKENDIFVICDEAYSNLYYGEKSRSFSQFQDIRDRIIVCQSFSKPYAMTGWRIGYLLADKSIMEHIYKLHQYTVLAVNTFVQYAGVEALKTDVKPYIIEFKKRRDYVCSRLVSMGFDVIKPEGAFYVFPSIQKFGIDSFTFCKGLVEQEKVAITPGICFDAEGFVRISYCVDIKTLEIALDKLEKYIKTL